MGKNIQKKSIFYIVLLAVLLTFTLAVAVACSRSYTLTFETGGGTIIAPINAKAGEVIETPENPTLDGHIFEGWYLTEDFSEGPVELPKIMPDENITYYARFSAEQTATLTLDPAGGTLDTTVYSLGVGQSLSTVLSQAIPHLDGAEFGGWFNGSSQIAQNAVMPAGGLSLTARYKATYVVEVYLENFDGEYGEPTDEIVFDGGSDWLGKEIKLSSSVLKAPEGFLLDQTMTQSITLAAGKNVYKAYFYRTDGYVYYFVNAPQGFEYEGEMDYATVPYGASHEVADSGYSVRGYRFAGWSTSPDGDVEFGAGDEIAEVKGTVMLYACWNYGATDLGGGGDRIYLLMEDSTHVVLYRPVLGEKTGSYDADTRLFEFEISDGETLRGRMLADGRRFAYFDAETALELFQYDGASIGAAKIELDGLDSATYTTENGTAVSGTYTRVSPMVYQFSSQSHTFRFRLDKVDGQDVFWMSDGFEGTYYYYNGGISYPIVILDGFGGAGYLANADTSVLTGGYVWKDDVMEVVYPGGSGEVSFLCRLGEEQGKTTSGDVTTVAVFYLADDTRGEYVLTDLNGRELAFRSDGFGKAYYGEKDSERETDYVYYREHGYYVVVDGKINYVGYVSMEVDGKSVFGRLNMTEKYGELAEYNTVWTEENARSGFTVKLRIFDSQTASIEVSMTNGRYQQVISGTNTYDETSGIYHFVAEWFAADTENIKYRQLLAPFYADFYYKSQGASSFVIADDAESEYTIHDASTVYTLKCDGFGKGSLLKQGDTRTVAVVYTFQKGYSVGRTNYDFITFTLEMSQFTVRVNSLTKEGHLITFYSELENRLPEEGESFGFTATNNDGVGSAFIRFPDGNGGYVVGVDGSYSALAYSNTDGQVVYMEFTFTAEYFAENFEALAESGYDSFVFRYYPALGNYFFVYDSAEKADFVISDGETRIEFAVNGDGTAWLGNLLCVVSLTDDEYTLTTASGARGVVRIVGEGTAQLAGSERGTYFALDNGVPTLEKYLLFLDGFGGASLQSYEPATDGGQAQISEVASGAYVRVESESGYYEYDVTFQGDEFEDFRFAYGTISLGQSTVAVYIVYDEGNVESFVLSDGGKLEIDAYGEATFRDEAGNARGAAAVREADDVVEGRELMRVRVLNEDGRGYGEEKIYAISVDGQQKSLLLLDAGRGIYNLLDGDKISSSTILVLDGLGNASLFEDGGETAALTGSYSAADGENEWNFLPADSSERAFRFTLMTDVLSTDGDSFDLFAVYAEQWECRMVSSGWEVAAFNGYGYGTYIDRLGRAYSVYYELVDENTIRIYGASLGELWLTADFETGAFVSSTEAPAA